MELRDRKAFVLWSVVELCVLIFQYSLMSVEMVFLLL
jgi:hypothetical protein